MLTSIERYLSVAQSACRLARASRGDRSRKRQSGHSD